jgi:ATP-dependent Clp protease ATP-binding subunit ClpB
MCDATNRYSFWFCLLWIQAYALNPLRVVQIEQGEFTEMAWQAITAAVDVARDSKQQVVEPEHLMKALLEQRNGLARRIFAKAGIDNTALLQATERFIERQPKVRWTCASPSSTVACVLVERSQKFSRP